MNRYPVTAVEVDWLGRVEYVQALEIQRQSLRTLALGERQDTLLLLEHPHVFTMGRRATIEHVLWDDDERRARSVDLIWTDRGGDVTYHGPGQLVAYLIADLERLGRDVLSYLRGLEQTVIRLLSELGIDAHVDPPLTGVWTAQGKIAAIGVRASGSKVSHGLALNVRCDLDYFTGIVPCGLQDKKVTSILELGQSVTVEQCALLFAAHFGREFGVKTQWVRRPKPLSESGTTQP